MHTGADLLTDKQRRRLVDLFATDVGVEAEATWGIYQRMSAAYRDPARGLRRTAGEAERLISTGVPAALVEVVTLGKTLTKCAVDVLVTSTDPAPATGPGRRSMDGSDIYAEQPWGSAI